MTATSDRRCAALDCQGLILSGGQGSRMGGVDKGLQPYQGRPLVAYVIERLAPQVAHLTLSANRNLPAYAAFGHPVLSDKQPTQFDGPLAGMLAGLQALPADTWLQVAPCDAPYLPLDLVARLQAALGPRQWAALPRAGGRLQPTFCLINSRLAANLADYLARGGRKVQGWLLDQNPALVDFDDADAFANFNTLSDLDCP